MTSRNIQILSNVFTALPNDDVKTSNHTTYKLLQENLCDVIKFQ